MSVKTIFWVIFLSFMPISELRGAIPVAVSQGFALWQAAVIAIICNALVAPVAYIFLETVHKLLYKWKFYANIFDKFVTKAREKVEKKVQKYGYLGIMLFVAVPLPVTGAWTGTLGAWILGLEKRKTILAVALGVVISGIIVSLVVFFGVEALSLFIKKV